MKNNRKNKMIECCRFAATIMVILIHCPIRSNIHTYAEAVARAAVPFFLIVSGYFVYGKEVEITTFKKIKDTLGIIANAGFICMLWNCANSCIESGSALGWFGRYMNHKTLTELVFFNRAVFFNSVFYYFFMILYVYLVYLAAAKTKTIKLIYAMILPLFAASLYILRHTGLPWYYAGNFLFTGIPFFFTGHYISSHRRIIERAKGREWILLTAGIALCLAERHISGDYYLSVGDAVIAVTMLLFSVNHPYCQESTVTSDQPCPVAVISWLGTHCSLSMILFHCNIMDTLRLVTKISDYVMPLAVTMISLILALIINIPKCVQHSR